MPGLLSRLLGSSTTPAPPRVHKFEATLYEGDETLEVRGESHYQEALWAIVGGRRPERIRCERYAVLIPDPDNDYDADAIEVRIDGQLVGYLSQDDAGRYHEGLLRLMHGSANHLVALHAMIVGGGQRPDGLGYLGVFLDHDPADFGLEPQHTTNGRIRTGLSAAIATDIADDRYDLSWYAQLSGDDATAIAQLRSLLQSVSDALDRHYMFCELEHRLYHCRDTVVSALDDFDTVCRQHHDEMPVIRPALLDKFGVVPVIEMYRQATIRCAKAKLWQASRQWAERGISVYGDDAARPEVVEDLHKRVAHAIAKSEAADRPKPRERRGTTVPASTERVVQMESLICAACGATFQRVRTSGRKPRLCPTCRGVATPPRKRVPEATVAVSNR